MNEAEKSPRRRKAHAARVREARRQADELPEWLVAVTDDEGAITEVWYHPNGYTLGEAQDLIREAQEALPRPMRAIRQE